MSYLGTWPQVPVKGEHDLQLRAWGGADLTLGWVPSESELQENRLWPLLPAPETSTHHERG